ncbi:MAG: hypothetical protein FJY98_01115 [Candidatus Liptonbacteria bacterium]|nr:hypothetical protein [Candidatus Liptonbacteria bacterium]
MRLITLNTFGGKCYEPLLEFIKQETPTTDLFLFQEMFRSNSDATESRGIRTNMFGEFSQILPEFEGFFAAEQDGWDFEGKVDFDISAGQATFVRKSIQVLSTEETFVYRERNGAVDTKTIPSVLLCTRIAMGPKTFSISNLHGLAHPPETLAKLHKEPHFLGHRDTPDRLLQSEKVLEFLKGEKEPKIICGDFNLRPDTQSFALLAEHMRNLVEEFSIERTRSRLSKHFNKKDFDAVVDYILVSHDVAVERFEVPNVEISDHLPLILEFH